METAAIRLTLPYPPGVNHMWRSAGRGTTYLSREYKAFKQAVADACRYERVRPLAGPVRVTLHVYRPKRVGDLDGRIKALLDALNGHAYADDGQIVEIHAYRYDDKNDARVEVTVEESK